MRRDMDLVRELLLAIEGEGEDPLGWMVSVLPHRDPTLVSYHVQLLHEAGLIVAIDLSSCDGYDWRPKRMTYAGHDLLDSIRDPDIWGRTKGGVEAAGGFTLDLMKALAKGFLKKQIEERTGVSIDL